jgi:3D (Asp-Asp-Asp) domain-containing protein
MTASGKKVAVGMVAGPRRIPLGTRVLIGGVPYTVEDRTAKRYDGRWDIYFQSHKAALIWGKQEKDVVIIK